MPIIWSSGKVKTLIGHPGICAVLLKSREFGATYLIIFFQISGSRSLFNEYVIFQKTLPVKWIQIVFFFTFLKYVKNILKSPYKFKNFVEKWNLGL